MAYYLSENESAITGLKVCRNAEILEEFNVRDVLDICRNKAADLVRIKVNVQDNKLFQELERCGMPMEIFTINTQFAHRVDEHADYLEKVAGNLSIQKVTADNQELFEDTVQQIMSTKSWHPYEGSLLDILIDRATARRLELDFFANFGKGGNKHAWLIYADNNCVGAFMGSEEENRFHGTLYGILETYRSHGYSKAIYQFMFDECQKGGWKEFVNEIHFQNQNSLNSALHSSMRPIRTFFNISIFPLLSLSNYSERRKLTLNELSQWLDPNLTTDTSTVIRTTKLNHDQVPDNGELIRLFSKEKRTFEVCLLNRNDHLVGAVYLNERT